MGINDICSDIVDYKRNYESEEFLEMYETRQDIYDNYFDLMQGNPKGVLDEISEDIHTILKYKNLNNKEINNQFQDACKLAEKINSYSNYKEKNFDEKLAWDLVDYAKNFDTYDYNDNYETDEDAFNDMCSSLTKENIDSTIQWLGEDISILANEKDLKDPEMNKLINQAFNLLCRVNCYKTELEKTKTDEMDI